MLDVLNLPTCDIVKLSYALLKPTAENDVQEINSFAEGVIEELEPQQSGLQALLVGKMFLCMINCCFWFLIDPLFARRFSYWIFITEIPKFTCFSHSFSIYLQF